MSVPIQPFFFQHIFFSDIDSIRSYSYVPSHQLSYVQIHLDAKYCPEFLDAKDFPEFLDAKYVLFSSCGSLRQI